MFSLDLCSTAVFKYFFPVGKHEQWDTRIIALQLRRLAVEFDAQFQAANILPHRDKSCASLVSCLFTDVINDPQLLMYNLYTVF